MSFNIITIGDVDRVLSRKLSKVYYLATGIAIGTHKMFVTSSYGECRFAYLEDPASGEVVSMACICPARDMVGENHIGTRVNVSLPKFSGALYVSNLVTHDDHQKKGYARKLTQHIVDHFGKDHDLLADTELSYLGSMFESMGFTAQEEKFLMDCGDIAYLRPKKT
jgi:GNAT superfamily N-acetyltransferase